MSAKRVLTFALPEKAQSLSREDAWEYYERVLNPTLLANRDILYEHFHAQGNDPGRPLDITWEFNELDKTVRIEIEARPKAGWFASSAAPGRMAGQVAGALQINLEKQGFALQPERHRPDGPRATKQMIFSIPASSLVEAGSGNWRFAAEANEKFGTICDELTAHFGSDAHDPEQRVAIAHATYPFNEHRGLLLVTVSVAETSDMQKGLWTSVMGSAAASDAKRLASLLCFRLESDLGAKKGDDSLISLFVPPVNQPTQQR